MEQLLIDQVSQKETGRRLDVLVYPNKKLSTKANWLDISSPFEESLVKFSQIAEDLFTTLDHYGGVGLAATQVGILNRIFVVKVETETDFQPGPVFKEVFFNPQVISSSDETIVMNEACLSVPGVAATISRPEKVEISWIDLNGSLQKHVFSGTVARV